PKCGHAGTFRDAYAEPQQLPSERLHGMEGQRCAIAARYQGADAMAGKRRDDPAQFRGADQFLMIEARVDDRGATDLEFFQLRLIRGDEQMALRNEAAIVVEQI